MTFFPQTGLFGALLSLGSSWGLCGNEKYKLISTEIGTGLYVRENKFPLECFSSPIPHSLCWRLLKVELFSFSS